MLSRRAVLAGAGVSAFAVRARAQAERVLRFIPDAPLIATDPLGTEAVTRTHGFMVWDTLFGLDAERTPRPQMCESYDVSPDGRRWRFKLREGLAFHDGSAVDPLDCIASLARWMKHNPYGMRLERALDTLAEGDERSFEIRLSKPYPRMLQALASPVPPVCFIMPERIATAGADAPIKEIVGSGPYMFLHDEFQPGARAAYARFDKYLPRQEAPSVTAGGKVARFDRVEWLGVGDPALAVAALRDGLADWWETALEDMVPVLRASRGVRLQQLDPFGRMAVLRLNGAVPPFSDLALRRALLPDIDQDAFMSAVASDPDRARTGVGVFPPGSPLANAAGLAALTDARDPGASARLVQGSGHAGAGIMLLACADRPADDMLAGVARLTMERVGLEVETMLPGASDFDARITEGRWNAVCASGDALAFDDPISHDAITGAPAADLAALRDAWFGAENSSEERKAAEQIQTAVLQDVPYIPLGLWYPLTASAGLADFVRAPFPLFWSVRAA